LNLAALRLRNGLTLEEIASATRISLRFLEAIEAEDFAKLPGGVYAMSYLRQYCRAVGYDEAAVLARYRAQAEPTPVATAATPQRLPWLNWRPHQTLQSLLDHVAHRGRRQHAA
jgi:cytoskeletal protein RodZ